MRLLTEFGRVYFTEFTNHLSGDISLVCDRERGNYPNPKEPPKIDYFSELFVFNFKYIDQI